MPTADRSAMVIGFGMGGFLDFMLLHLVLQWHHMISNRVPPTSLQALQQNIFWDGVGQSLMWLITLVGIYLLLGAAQRRDTLPTTLRFTGLFLLGWGTFNLLDGVVNHHLLALHNVREDVANRMAWNLGFMLIAGILLPLAGWLMARAGRRAA